MVPNAMKLVHVPSPYVPSTSDTHALHCTVQKRAQDKYETCYVMRLETNTENTWKMAMHVGVMHVGDHHLRSCAHEGIYQHDANKIPILIAKEQSNPGSTTYASPILL
jgi:hypothetical protein